MLRLKNKLRSVPSKPGIYFFKNKNKQIIYIGKALSLKHRLKSYFAKNIRDPKTKLLVSQIANFEYQVVSSEFEALLLEAKLVKDHQPKYNLQLKDDKRPLYIAITKKPHRILSLRQPELENNLYDWFGPFPSSSSVRLVLRTIRRVFPYCSCKKMPKKQCLYSHINLCPGYQNLSSVQYDKDIKKIRKILTGKTQKLLKNLEKNMQRSAFKEDFERANVYKKQFQSLQYVTQTWKNIPSDNLSKPKALDKLQKLIIKYQGVNPSTINKIEGYDISNLSSQIIVGAMVSFINAVPEKSMYRKFKINFISPSSNRHLKMHEQNDPLAIYQIIKRRLQHPEWLYPQLILLDGGKAQVSAAHKALKEKGISLKIALLGLSKAKETIVIPKRIKQNIVSWKMLNYSPRSEVRQLLQQIRDESHRFAQNYYKALHYKKTFSYGPLVFPTKHLL